MFCRLMCALRAPPNLPSGPADRLRSRAACEELRFRETAQLALCQHSHFLLHRFGRAHRGLLADRVRRRWRRAASRRDRNVRGGVLCQQPLAAGEPPRCFKVQQMKDGMGVRSGEGGKRVCWREACNEATRTWRSRALRGRRARRVPEPVRASTRTVKSNDIRKRLHRAPVVRRDERDYFFALLRSVRGAVRGGSRSGQAPS